MNYLIITFDGFGDGIIYYPFLRDFERMFPESKFFYTSNMFFSDESIKKNISIPNNVFLVNESFRKFKKDNWIEISKFILENNIRRVINLRTIGRRFEPEYFLFKEYFLSKKNDTVQFYDIELLPNENIFNSNIRDILASIFEKATGLKMDYIDKNRLSCYYDKDEYPEGVLINIHTRGIFKLWELSKWASLVSSLVLSKRKVEILSGCGEEESMYTQKFLNLFPVDIAKAVSVVKTDNLYELGLLINKRKLIISVDSGVIHFADSLGVESLGIYTMTSPSMWGGITKKSHSVSSNHMLNCPNYYPYFGMCMNNKRKCECIDFGRDDVSINSVLSKIEHIFYEKEN